MTENITDACHCLNLLATGRSIELLETLNIVLVMSPQAHAEVRYLHGPPDAAGLPTLEPAPLEPLIEARRLRIQKLEGPALDRFPECAAHLRDADASCLALAVGSGHALATDDGKVRKIARRLFPRIELVTILQVIRRATEQLHLGEPDLMTLLHHLCWRGSFQPPRGDPDGEWYRRVLTRNRGPT